MDATNLTELKKIIIIKQLNNVFVKCREEKYLKDNNERTVADYQILPIFKHKCDTEVTRWKSIRYVFVKSNSLQSGQGVKKTLLLVVQITLQTACIQAYQKFQCLKTPPHLSATTIGSY